MFFVAILCAKAENKITRKNGVNMRKHFILLLCLVGLAAPTRLHASQNLIHEVEGFYEKFESSMSAGDYKTTLGLIDKYVAKDFAHYDDGEFTYGKEKFKSIV